MRSDSHLSKAELQALAAKRRRTALRLWRKEHDEKLNRKLADRYVEHYGSEREALLAALRRMTFLGTELAFLQLKASDVVRIHGATGPALGALKKALRRPLHHESHPPRPPL